VFTVSVVPDLNIGDHIWSSSWEIAGIEVKKRSAHGITAPMANLLAHFDKQLEEMAADSNHLFSTNFTDGFLDKEKYGVCSRR